MVNFYWRSWFFATLLAGLVSGFHLGAAFMLTPFLSWLTANKKTQETFAAFNLSASKTGTIWYMVLSVLQPLTASVFFVVSIVTGQHIGLAIFIVTLSLLWLVASIATGFREVEKTVLRSQREIPDEVTEKYIAWNVPLHIFNGVVLLIGFATLLYIPFA